MIAPSHKRPAFDPSGLVRARREMTLSGKTYESGQDLPADALTGRQLSIFWQQGLVDTLPRPAAPAPAQASGKHQQHHQHRR